MGPTKRLSWFGVSPGERVGLLCPTLCLFPPSPVSFSSFPLLLFPPPRSSLFCGALIFPSISGTPEENESTSLPSICGTLQPGGQEGLRSLPPPAYNYPQIPKNETRENPEGGPVANHGGGGLVRAPQETSSVAGAGSFWRITESLAQAC